MIDEAVECIGTDRRSCPGRMAAAVSTAPACDFTHQGGAIHVYSRRRYDRHWAESRFLTFADHEKGNDWVRLRDGDQEMTMTFASLEGAVMQESRGLPIAPRRQATVIRWMGARSTSDNLHVTALNPGKSKLALDVKRDAEGDGYVVEVSGEDGYARTVSFTPGLVLKE